MKAILLIFDSLNRHFLPPYGCDWVQAPNFARLAKRSLTFDNHYIGSMPTIPARRELHTGRYNFLHRGWGPLEPFDDSMPQILRENGVYSHLITDNYHYFEDGAATYHNRYSSYEFVRGQEGDLWKGQLAQPEIPVCMPNRRVQETPWWRQDWINRGHMQSETEHTQFRTFELGLDFIKANHEQNDWFLHMEAFDPHEPFFCPKRYQDLYPHHYDGPHFDWPQYGPVTETPEQVAHLRYQYAALLSMCDEHLGKVLQLMDDLDLWSDTMLIVTTDHGLLLGEHGWWGKNLPPWYNEIARIPLFMWDPRFSLKNERRGSLVQMIDLCATLLDYFGQALPPDVQGKPLGGVIEADAPVRGAALFGMHGMQVNCTDGRYLYMRAPVNPENQPLFDYTLMPTRPRGLFSLAELGDMELADAFPFSKDCRTLMVATPAWRDRDPFDLGTRLFDLQNDPQQENPLSDPNIEAMMQRRMVELMKNNHTPPEQFERLGLTGIAG